MNLYTKLSIMLPNYLDQLRNLHFEEKELSELINKIEPIFKQAIQDKKESYYKDLALEWSNYKEVLNYLIKQEINGESLERFKNIDWEAYDKGEIKPCSERPWYVIKRDLKNDLWHGNSLLFDSHLNELLGNCCIENIDDLYEE